MNFTNLIRPNQYVDQMVEHEEIDTPGVAPQSRREEAVWMCPLGGALSCSAEAAQP